MSSIGCENARRFFTFTCAIAYTMYYIYWHRSDKVGGANPGEICGVLSTMRESKHVRHTKAFTHPRSGPCKRATKRLFSFLSAFHPNLCTTEI